MQGRAHDGTGFNTTALIRAVVDGTVSTGIIPTRWEFYVMDTSGASQLPLVLYNHTTRSYRRIHVQTDTDGQNEFKVIMANNSAPTARFSSDTSKGTLSAKTTVASGNLLQEIMARAYDGTNYIQTQYIRTYVDGTVSAGIVPSRIEIGVTNSSGAIASLVKILATETQLFNDLNIDSGKVIKIANTQVVSGSQIGNSNTQVVSNGYVYRGDPNTDGSWRDYVSGGDLIFEKREGGSWVEKGRFVA